MNTNKYIWVLSKMRFFQTESQFWVFNAKSLDILIIISMSLFIYFEFLTQETLYYLNYVFLLITLYFYSMRIGRQYKFIGFFDGYENGFNDAATRHISYIGQDDPFNFDYDHRKAEACLEIEERLKDVSDKYKQEQNKAIREGLNRASGIFTWVNLKDVNFIE